eukprot:Nk52_evm51s255 gene=Nk52_evmTU51s255
MNNSYERALQIVKLHINAYKEAEIADGNLFKIFLTLILLHLHLNDEVAASKFYEDSLHTPGFLKSEESRAAHEAIQAFEEGDQESLDSTISKQTFRFLDNEVLKFCKQLSVPGGRKKKAKDIVASDSTTVAGEESGNFLQQGGKETNMGAEDEESDEEGLC